MGKRRGETKKSEYIEWIIVAVVLLGYFLIVLMSYYRDVRSDAALRVNKDVIAHGERLSDSYMDKIDILKQTTVTAANMIGEKNIDIHGSIMLARLGRVVSYSPAYTGMLIDLDGKGKRITGENVSMVGNDYYNASMSNECIISDIVFDDYINDYAVSVFAPIMKGNKILGTVCLSMRASMLTDSEPVDDIDGKTMHAILNSEGIMTTIYGERIENGTSIYDYIGGKTTNEARKLIQNIENRKSGVLDVTAKGEKWLLNYRAMDINGWYTVEFYSQKYIERKQNTYYRGAKTVIVKLIVALVIFFLISSLIAASLIVLLINIFSQMIYSSKSKELQNKAETDLLTGMLNKVATERHIQDYIDNEGKNTPGMLILIDVDNFKKINDTMGHAFGDQVLSTLGHTISNEFRISDIFGRIGGDEFILYLKNIPSDEIRNKEAKKLVMFFKNFQAGDYVKYSVGASIGVSMYPKDGASFDELYKAADKAVYRSKQAGKNQLRFYSDEETIVKA